jgi:hypothetical protein
MAGERGTELGLDVIDIDESCEVTSPAILIVAWDWEKGLQWCVQTAHFRVTPTIETGLMQIGMQIGRVRAALSG